MEFYKQFNEDPTVLDALHYFYDMLIVQEIAAGPAKAYLEKWLSNNNYMHMQASSFASLLVTFQRPNRDFKGIGAASGASGASLRLLMMFAMFCETCGSRDQFIRLNLEPQDSDAKRLEKYYTKIATRQQTQEKA